MIPTTRRSGKGKTRTAAKGSVVAGGWGERSEQSGGRGFSGQWTFLHDVIMTMHVVVRLLEPTECTPARANPDGTYGRRGTLSSQCGFISYNECARNCKFRPQRTYYAPTKTTIFKRPTMPRTDEAEETCRCEEIYIWKLLNGIYQNRTHTHPRSSIFTSKCVCIDPTETHTYSMHRETRVADAGNSTAWTARPPKCPSAIGQISASGRTHATKYHTTMRISHDHVRQNGWMSFSNVN